MEGDQPSWFAQRGLGWGGESCRSRHTREGVAPPPVPCWWKNQGPMPVAVWERGVEHWGSELAWPDPEDPWQTMNCDTSSTV